MEGGKANKQTSIFEVLLTPTDGEKVPAPDKIKDEAISILAAASDTTGNALTVATYHIIKNPDIYRTLRAELEDAFPDEDSTLDYLLLEKLPYLVSFLGMVASVVRADLTNLVCCD